MTTRRIAGSLVFAAAAFASIATSAPMSWELEANATIDSTEVITGPATAWGITAEARGPLGSYDGGELTVSVQIHRIGDQFADATVRLISERDPALNQTLIVSENTTASFFVQAFEACTESPCFEDFRLEVELIAEHADANVNGDVRVVLSGSDAHEREDNAVLVEVVPLGIVR